jgi:hypothetical protein
MMSPRRLQAPILALIALLAVHCRREHAPAATEVTSGQAAESAKSCPLGVEGSELRLADAPGGIDVTMTAPPDQIDELRARMREAAALHGAGAHEGLGHDGEHVGAHRHGLRLTALPAMDAKVEDIAGGARMHLVAKASDEVGQLRAQLRDRVVLVLAARCD